MIGLKFLQLKGGGIAPRVGCGKTFGNARQVPVPAPLQHTRGVSNPVHPVLSSAGYWSLIPVLTASSPGHVVLSLLTVLSLTTLCPVTNRCRSCSESQLQPAAAHGPRSAPFVVSSVPSLSLASSHAESDVFGVPLS